MKSLLTMMLPLCCVFSLLNGTATAQATDAIPSIPLMAATDAPFHPFMTAAPLDIMGQWASSISMPSKKCYHGAAALNGSMYIFGGLGGTLRFDTQCYKYNLAGTTWSAIASLPVQRALPVVEAVGDKIYLIGGYSATNPFTVQRAVLEYDPATDSYTEKADMPMPVYGAGSFVHNGRIWVLGGGTTSFTTSTNAVQIYDPALDQWTFSLSLTPYASWATGVVLAGNTVMYVGGVRYTNNQGLFGAWAYTGSISGDEITWTEIESYPTGSVMRHAAGTDGQKAYFSGGYNQQSMNNGPPSGITYCYDPAAATWIRKDMKPTPVYFGSQMIFDGTDKLYVFGGQHIAGGVTDIVEVFDVTAEGGPSAVFRQTEFDVWLKNGDQTTLDIPVENIGSAAMNWSATVEATASTWMSLTSASGVVPIGESIQISLALNSSVGNGAHTGNVTVTTNDPDNSSVDISVTLHIQDEDVDTEMNVVLEEGTGTWCGFCPFGADTLKAMIAENPGRVFGISYHGGSTTEPMHTPHTDFWTALVGLRGWPQGSINRIQFDGTTEPALSRSAWRPRIEEVLQTRRSPISLSVTAKSYDEQTKQVFIETRVFFHRDLDIPLRMNIAQLQDQMNYTQSFYPPSGGSTKLFPYYHDHVLRQLIPSDAGQDFTQGMPLISQMHADVGMHFTSVDSTIETSRFVIFVHESDGENFGEILQAIELHLSDFITDVAPLPEHAELTLHPNYPNPFNPSTMVSFDLPERTAASLVVTDALGRVVARLVDDVLDSGRHSRSFSGSALSSGTYFLVLHAGDAIRTRSMTLMR
ncbi:MAG: Omp28-related outer membrane protein [Bacteroidetes bacterium]|nr:Omp28-related outer membrane protein [Bacteroidota bacterium]